MHGVRAGSPGAKVSHRSMSLRVTLFRHLSRARYLRAFGANSFRCLKTSRRLSLATLLWLNRDGLLASLDEHRVEILDSVKCYFILG